MTVSVVDHQGKSAMLKEAVKDIESSWLLIDSDQGRKADIIADSKRHGKKIALYSHGAPVVLVWDGIMTPNPDVDLYLAQSEGEKEIMQAYGYPAPIEVIGWHYCEQKPFQPAKKLENVLFAPWHPDSRGLVIEARKANNDTFHKLEKGNFKLTVRYARSLDNIPIVSGVDYKKSDYTIESSVIAIDNADLIVANCSTFACLAIARGKPVIMYGQDIHKRPADNGTKMYKHWDDYKGLLWYSNDMSNNLIIERAMLNEDVWWRDKFISMPLNELKLKEVLN